MIIARLFATLLTYSLVSSSTILQALQARHFLEGVLINSDLSTPLSLPVPLLPDRILYERVDVVMAKIFQLYDAENLAHSVLSTLTSTGFAEEARKASIRYDRSFIRLFFDHNPLFDAARSLPKVVEPLILTEADGASPFVVRAFTARLMELTVLNARVMDILEALGHRMHINILHLALQVVGEREIDGQVYKQAVGRIYKAMNAFSHRWRRSRRLMGVLDALVDLHEMHMSGTASRQWLKARGLEVQQSLEPLDGNFHLEFAVRARIEEYLKNTLLADLQVDSAQRT